MFTGAYRRVRKHYRFCPANAVFMPFIHSMRTLSAARPLHTPAQRSQALAVPARQPAAKVQPVQGARAALHPQAQVSRKATRVASTIEQIAALHARSAVSTGGAGQDSEQVKTDDGAGAPLPVCAARGVSRCTCHGPLRHRHGRDALPILRTSAAVADQANSSTIRDERSQREAACGRVNALD